MAKLTALLKSQEAETSLPGQRQALVKAFSELALDEPAVVLATTCLELILNPVAATRASGASSDSQGSTVSTKRRRKVVRRKKRRRRRRKQKSLPPSHPPFDRFGRYICKRVLLQ